jgi:hypothetical protein
MDCWVIRNNELEIVSKDAVDTGTEENQEKPSILSVPFWDSNLDRFECYSEALSLQTISSVRIHLHSRNVGWFSTDYQKIELFVMIATYNFTNNVQFIFICPIRTQNWFFNWIQFVTTYKHNLFENTLALSIVTKQQEAKLRQSFAELSHGM